MEKLKRFLALLVALCFLSSALYSEAYYPAEKIDPLLQELENELKTQEIQLQSLEAQLKEASESLKISEKKELRNNLLILSVSLFVGFSAGAVTGILVSK